MRIYGDYHMHTPLCQHATGPMEAYVERALALGLCAVGFSDHTPLPRGLSPTVRMKESELDYYVERVTDLRFRYRGQIEVLLGLELDYLPHLEEYLHRRVRQYPWDYILGSVHYLDPDCRELSWSEIIAAADPARHYRRYFERVRQLAQSGLFDILAHFDVPKRSGFLPDESVQPDITRTLEEIARAGLVLEINTSGYRHPELPAPQPYPSLEIVEQAHRLGIPLMVNSDAHAPEDVGGRFREMEDFLRRIGCRQLVRFDARQRITYRL